jgi:hypothetical protein
MIMRTEIIVMLSLLQSTAGLKGLCIGESGRRIMNRQTAVTFLDSTPTANWQFTRIDEWLSMNHAPRRVGKSLHSRRDIRAVGGIAIHVQSTTEDRKVHATAMDFGEFPRSVNTQQRSPGFTYTLS